MNDGKGRNKFSKDPSVEVIGFGGTLGLILVRLLGS